MNYTLEELLDIYEYFEEPYLDFEDLTNPIY